MARVISLDCPSVIDAEEGVVSLFSHEESNMAYFIDEIKSGWSGTLTLCEGQFILGNNKTEI